MQREEVASKHLALVFRWIPENRFTMFDVNITKNTFKKSNLSRCIFLKLRTLGYTYTNLSSVFCFQSQSILNEICENVMFLYIF